MDSLVGGMLGRYRIEGWLGRGGMSTVYRALDPVFGRSVAVKVLTAQLAHDPQYTSRFQREARSMARLQHPHILPVYDVGDQNGTVFLVMQYIEGGNLHEYLAEQRRIGELYTERALGILEAVAGALDFAHGQGIVHRDVKPQNILLTPRGYPYLTDFGIAKILDQENADTSFSLANAIIGTPEYMSPEQAQGQPLDGRGEGAMACSTCHVIVAAEDFAVLPPASEEEDDLLDLAAHVTRTSRLACQLTLIL